MYALPCRPSTPPRCDASGPPPPSAAGGRAQRDAELDGERPPWRDDTGQLGGPGGDDELGLHGADDVVLQPGIAGDEEHGGQRLVALGARLHVDVRGAVVVPAERGEEGGDGAAGGRDAV